MIGKDSLIFWKATLKSSAFEMRGVLRETSKILKGSRDKKLLALELDKNHLTGVFLHS